MADVCYVVDTGRCTYLLDDRGRCSSVAAPSGAMVPEPAKACIGAQFVASLDFRIEGGLSPELLVGAHALFVRPDHDGRMMLLRTALVLAIDFYEMPSRVVATARPAAVEHPVKQSRPLPSRSRSPELPPRVPERRAPPALPRSLPRPTNLPTFPSYQGDEESLTILRPSYPHPSSLPRNKQESWRATPSPVPPPRRLPLPPRAPPGAPPPRVPSGHSPPAPMPRAPARPPPRRR